MSQLKEKIAYLQGLAEGLGLDRASKEGKLFSAVIDVLDEMSLAIKEVSDNQAEIESYVEAIDEDLGEMEDDIYGKDEDFDFEDDEECDCCDEECDCSSFVEVACPKCHEILRLESCILEDEDTIEITCPSCDETIYINEDNMEMKEDK